MMSEKDDGWREQELRRLKHRQIVNLPAMVELHKWLDEARRYRQSGRIIGDSRTGKTIACEKYCYDHRTQGPSQPGRPRPTPILYTFPPEMCGRQDLFEAILKGLRYRFNRGGLLDMRRRVHGAMEECAVEEWIIDEGQRLQSRAFSEVRDILDRLNLAVVVVGTHRLNTVLRRDEQVDNRLITQYIYRPLDGEPFKLAVGLWEENVLKLPVASNLMDHDMITRLQGITHGLLGRLDHVLRKAACIALETHEDRIDREILERAARHMH